MFLNPDMLTAENWAVRKSSTSRLPIHLEHTLTCTDAYTTDRDEYCTVMIMRTVARVVWPTGVPCTGDAFTITVAQGRGALQACKNRICHAEALLDTATRMTHIIPCLLHIGMSDNLAAAFTSSLARQ